MDDLEFELDLIEDDPIVERRDLDEAYYEGFDDATDMAIGLVKKALKQVRSGGELRHKEVQDLLKALEKQSRR